MMQNKMIAPMQNVGSRHYSICVKWLKAGLWIRNREIFIHILQIRIKVRVFPRRSDLFISLGRIRIKTRIRVKSIRIHNQSHDISRQYINYFTFYKERKKYQGEIRSNPDPGFIVSRNRIWVTSTRNSNPGLELVYFYT